MKQKFILTVTIPMECESDYTPDDVARLLFDEASIGECATIIDRDTGDPIATPTDAPRIAIC